MTYSEIKAEIKSRLNLSTTDADLRVGTAINRHYKRITSTLGMDATRFVTRSASTTNGVQTVTFSNIEKIDRLLDTTDATSIRPLHEVSVHELRSQQPGSGSPGRWATQSTAATSVTVLLDTVPQTTYSLQADGKASIADLTGDDEPAFPQSFHDVITWSVLAEELIRKEKPELAIAYESKAKELISELRFQLADSHTMSLRQANGTLPMAGGGSGSGGGSNQGGSAYTQTALLTFDRGVGAAPFAVAQATAAVVTNLDADKLDGQHGSYYSDASNLTGTLPAMSGVNLTALNATELTSGTVPLARLVNITNAEISATAAVAWTKVSKTGSSLADLTTKSAADLSSGTLPDARFPSTLPALNGSALTALGPANVAAGTFAVILSNSAQPRAVAYHNTTQSLSDSTFTALSLNSEDVDVGTMHDLVTNNSRVTIPTGGGGFYRVHARVNYGANNTGQRAVEIFKNGTTALAITQLEANAISDHTQEVNWSGVLAAADFLQVRGYQSSGGSLNAGSATREYSTELSVVKLF